jgi:hypothetical protein
MLVEKGPVVGARALSRLQLRWEWVPSPTVLLDFDAGTGAIPHLIPIAIHRVSEIVNCSQKLANAIERGHQQCVLNVISCGHILKYGAPHTAQGLCTR